MSKITIQSLVNADLPSCWEKYNTPEHIMQWNHASPDWHCPQASNELRPGGPFSYTMAARDGSFSFDFGGHFTRVEAPTALDYTIADGRQVQVSFESQGTQTLVRVIFETENMNSEDMQQAGWQAILDNFARYAGNN
jgi:uncharacterized protein YndB with AHSA1/START domain